MGRYVSSRELVYKSSSYLVVYALIKAFGRIWCMGNLCDSISCYGSSPAGAVFWDARRCADDPRSASSAIRQLSLSIRSHRKLRPILSDLLVLLCAAVCTLG